MTEQEFLRQIWRPYDTIKIDGGIKGRVINVCFPTRSVQMNLPAGGKEWFRCEMIIEHYSSTGEPDDLEMISSLHGKLMKAIASNEMKDREIENLKSKLDGKPEDKDLKKLRKSVDSIYSTIGSIAMRMKQIDEYLKGLGVVDNAE